MSALLYSVTPFLHLPSWVFVVVPIYKEQKRRQVKSPARSHDEEDLWSNPGLSNCKAWALCHNNSPGTSLQRLIISCEQRQIAPPSSLHCDALRRWYLKRCSSILITELGGSTLWAPCQAATGEEPGDLNPGSGSFLTYRILNQSLGGRGWGGVGEEGLGPQKLFFSVRLERELCAK